MQIPIELIEQLDRGNCVLFAGAGISVGTHGQRGLPSCGDLALALARRCGYTGSDLSLPRVAQYYELEKGRPALVEFITDRIIDPQIAPLFAHKLITQLPFRVVITTNWDRLLERAYEGASKPYRLVVRNEEISYLAPDKITLIKIHGSIEQPDTLVITEDDYFDFFSELPTVATVLKAEFATKPLLFLGYSLEDFNFKRLYTEVTREVDRHKRRAYAVQRAPSEFAVKWWRHKEVVIIDADATEFLEALVAEVGKFAPRDRTEAILLKRELVQQIPKRPYKALNYFEPEDQDIFFGRREDARRLLSLIASYRLVLLFGESGAGKTSLINAGVIPYLARAGYLVISVRALEDPAAAIRREVNRQLSKPVQSVSMSLREFLKQAIEAPRTSGPEPASHMQALVIVFDQFEEFFIRLSPEFRSAFAKDLSEVYDDRDLPVKFVFSLREDYFARLSELEWRIPEVFRNKLWLKRLARHQAAEAITEPVRAFGMNYEPVLLERLLDDLFDDGVYPPHLQIVCNQLYDTLDQSEKEITLAHYEELGGAERILATYTSAVLAEFPGHLKTIATATLSELVTSLNTKAVLEESTLAVRVGGRPEDQATVWDKLVNTRLVRRYEGDGKVYYELAHEYLVGEITRWIDEEQRELKKARELLAQEVDNWHRYEMLMPRDRLDILVTHRERLELDADAQELLARSALAVDVEPLTWLRRVTMPEVKERLLVEAIRDTRPAIRIFAVSELGNVSSAAAYEALLGAALEDTEPVIRWTAAEWLLQMAPAAASEHLLAVARDPTARNYAQALEALVVLWEGSTPIQTTSYRDWTRLVPTALGMNLAGRKGPLRQFGVFGFLGGLLGGVVSGMISSVTEGYFMRPLLLPLSTFVSWVNEGGIERLLRSWYLQIWELVGQLVLVFHSITSLANDQDVRQWLSPILVLYLTLLVILWSVRKRHLAAQAFWEFWSMPLFMLFLPVRIIKWVIRESVEFSRSLPNLLIRHIWQTRRGQLGMIVLLSIMLFEWSVIGLGLAGGVAGSFAGIGLGMVQMLSLGATRRREIIFGPALGCSGLALVLGAMVVASAITATISGRTPSTIALLGLIVIMAQGLAIGLGAELALSSARWPICTEWAWQIVCWLAGRPNLAAIALQHAPSVSLVGLLVAFTGSIAVTLLLRQPASDIFLYGPVVVTLALTMAMAHAVPTAVRQEIAGFDWLQKDEASKLEL